MVVGISSPYRRTGLLHQKHRDFFGANDPHVLVIQAPTTALNPTVNKAVINRARATDAEAARAEWDAMFRADLAALLDDASIDAAVEHGRPLELPPRRDHHYAAFVDPSGGRHDAFTLGISHLEGKPHVVDAVRGAKPPFDPSAVAAEFAALAQEYGCNSVTGDAYGAEWVAAAFKDAGVQYKRAERAKSALYLEMLPLFSRGVVSLPNHPVLLRELRLLERRTSRSGRDAVDHPQNGSDDYANALAGCLCACPTSTFNHEAMGC